MSETVWSKVCEKLVSLSIIPEKTIYKFQIIPECNFGDVTLKINTKKNNYVAQVSISENLDSDENSSYNTSCEYPPVIIEEDKLRIVINDFTIEGYKAYMHEEINRDHDINRFKSILKALAYNHSRSIKRQDTKLKMERNYSLTKEYPHSEEYINILHAIVKNKYKHEVNDSLFKSGLENLVHSSEEDLKESIHNLYVDSHILHGKLFFKSDDSGLVKCRILNVAPSSCLPLVFDVLLSIFCFSDKQMRQGHFHYLLDYYYKELEDYLQHIGLNISDILPPRQYQECVKKFSAYSKAELILFNCKQHLDPLDILESDNYTKIVSLFDSQLALKNLVVEICDCFVNKNLSREDCYKIVKKKLLSNDYEFINWKLTPIGGGRSGYLGDYYNLLINIKQNNAHKSFKFFAKYLPTYNEAANEAAVVSFNKEVFFYDRFVSDFENCGLAEITDFCPKHYLCRPNDVIILEDMVAMGYRSLPRGEYFDIEALLRITKEFAKLHANSLIYEEILTEKLGKPYRFDDDFGPLLKESLFALDNEGRLSNIVSAGIEGNVNYLLDKFPEIPRDISMEEFKKRLRALYDKMVTDEFKSTKYRNVVCQGDPWSNNFLFQVNDEGKVENCCIVDYQLTRYCAPSQEIMFLLYLNSDKEARTRYMSLILKEYYEELSRKLKKYGFDLSKIFTYGVFLESCEYEKIKIVPLASLYLQMIHYPADKLETITQDTEKFNHIFTVDRKEIIEEVHCNETYRVRIKEIVEELYDLCVTEM